MGITINRVYFDNIRTAVDSINNFFSSDYRMKNFPVEEEMEDLDGSIKTMIDYIRDVDLSYMTDEDKVYEDIEQLQDEVVNPDPGKPVDHEILIMRLHGIIGYFVIKFINENFEKFNTLINGIYSFDLFLNPSKYRDTLQTITSDVSYDVSLESLVKTEYGASNIKLFDLSSYVRNIFRNTDITLPSDLNMDDQIARIKDYRDLAMDISIDDTNSQNSPSNVTEAADINFFTFDKPPHLRYDVATKKWITSDQLHKAITVLIEGLKKCKTAADLKNYFKAPEREQDNFPEKFAATIMPTILSKVFCDKKKYPFTNYNVDHMAKYSLSYKSIASKDRGANNFNDADIFDCFKTDRDSTIKFIEDFMRLNLINDKNCAIGSKQLTILFNIFDSRIYFDLMYNILPKDIKKQFGTEDDFVKSMRKRVNENSRKVYIYNDDHTREKPEDATTVSVSEWASTMLDNFGDYTLEEAAYCGTFKTFINAEISTLDDRLYNNNVSAEEIVESVETFFNEEFNTGYDRPDFITQRLSIAGEKRKFKLPKEDPKKKKKESDSDDENDDMMDDIPSYMSTRIGLLDAEGKSPDVSFTNDTDIPDYQDSTTSAVTQVVNNSEPVKVSTNNNTELSSEGPDTSDDDEKDNDEKIDSNDNDGANKNNSAQVNKYNNTESTKKAENVTDNEDEKDDKNDVTLSNGKTVTEVFAMLEAFHKYDDQPLAPQKLSDTVKNDKSDISTFDPEETKSQTPIDKVKNFGEKTSTKLKGLKAKLVAGVNKLITSDETAVKKRMQDNPSYRGAIFKITNLAIKIGMFGLAAYCNKWIGLAFAVGEIAKWKDKPRLNKELQAQYATEIELIDQRLEKLKHANEGYSAAHDTETNEPLKMAEVEAEIRQLTRERARLVRILEEISGKTFIARKSRPI